MSRTDPTRLHGNDLQQSRAIVRATCQNPLGVHGDMEHNWQGRWHLWYTRQQVSRQVVVINRLFISGYLYYSVNYAVSREKVFCIVTQRVLPPTPLLHIHLSATTMNPLRVKKNNTDHISAVQHAPKHPGSVSTLSETLVHPNWSCPLQDNVCCFTAKTAQEKGQFSINWSRISVIHVTCQWF